MRIENAYAKINLYLDVVSRRENGYHNLVSIMQSVSLCDRVSLELTPAEETKITLGAEGNDKMPLGRKNIAYRAAELYLEATHQTAAVSIFIEKQIPMEAGLAGGSTDAAAVLRGLNAMNSNPLSTRELCALGARLGADVPFCITGGTAIVTGIGECLEYCPAMQKAPMVIARQGEGVSTVWAYGRLDELNNNYQTPKTISDAPERIIGLLADGEFAKVRNDIFNVFEGVISQTNACVETIKQYMLNMGAVCSMMSGSGPSVFGIFEDEATAERVCNELKAMGADAFTCMPCDRFLI